MRRSLPVAFLLLAMSIGGASAAQASCGVLPGTTLAGQIDAAPTVFVGTVIRTSNNDRVARVRVESVWKGPAVPTFVTVSGTPAQGSAATSVDRSFAVGQRYLLVPSTGSSPFQDSSCSATQLYSTQLDALKPATAQAPTPGSDGLDPTGWWLPAWIFPALAGLLLAAAAALWIARRRRLRDPSR
jgi:hypothetical protein